MTQIGLGQLPSTRYQAPAAQLRFATLPCSRFPVPALDACTPAVPHELGKQDGACFALPDRKEEAPCA